MHTNPANSPSLASFTFNYPICLTLLVLMGRIIEPPSQGLPCTGRLPNQWKGMDCSPALEVGIQNYVAGPQGFPALGETSQRTLYRKRRLNRLHSIVELSFYWNRLVSNRRAFEIYQRLMKRKGLNLLLIFVPVSVRNLTHFRPIFHKLMYEHAQVDTSFLWYNPKNIICM